MPKYRKQFWVMVDHEHRAVRVVWLAGMRPVEPEPHAGPFASALKANQRGDGAAKHFGYELTRATQAEE